MTMYPLPMVGFKSRHQILAVLKLLHRDWRDGVRHVNLTCLKSCKRCLRISQHHIVGLSDLRQGIMVIIQSASRTTWEPESHCLNLYGPVFILIICLTNHLAAQYLDLILREIFQTFFFYDFQSQLFLFLKCFTSVQTIGIFSADIHIS